MAGNPSTSTTGGNKGKEPQDPPRLFYSKGTGEEFIRQFNEILTKRDDNVKQAILESTHAITESIAALTAAILGRERSASPPAPSVTPLALAPPPLAPSFAPPRTPSLISNPDIDVTPPSEEQPRQQSPSDSPEHLDPRYLPPQKHTMTTLSPKPQRPLPIRELSVPPTTAQQSSGNQDGRLPMSTQTVPRFKGRDAENVIFWLHEMECLFVVYNVLDKNKVYNATRYIDGKAQKFYMYLLTTNNGKVPTWKEFRHAFISRYHHPASREDILRDKLSAVQFKGVRYMSDYCEDFRAIEAQIYEMAFPDRLRSFLDKLPAGAALNIRTAAGDTKDMEVVYRLAHQWASNVRSVIVPTAHRRTHVPPVHKPRLLKPVPAHRPPDKKPHKTDSDEELDMMNEDTDGEEDKVPLQVNKAEMSQVTCFRCRRVGHFAQDCKVKPAIQQRRTFTTKSPAKPVNNTIFATAMDANAYGIDEKGNELYAYDYDDDRTYSPSYGEETEPQDEANFMYLADTTEDTDALFTDYEDEKEKEHLKA